MSVHTHPLRAAGASVLAIAGLALAGCTVFPLDTVAPDPDPTGSSAAGEPTPCLNTINYPELPVWELNASLPIAGVSLEYTQYELGVTRGSDCSGGPRAVAVERACPVWTAHAEQTVDAMLDSSPDTVTLTEFARGSTAAITETVTGRTDDGGSFQYRMTAWQYPSADDAKQSIVPQLVEACTGATRETVGGVDRVAVYEGTEPHLVSFVDGDVSYLIESIRNISPDGTVAAISDTPSGLLPVSAIADIQAWWIRYGATHLDPGAGGDGESAPPEATGGRA